ncbi:MAG: hypothetical protein KGK10_13325 [Rhodospirillales bacterium]|nr:hypothetical protein [Rhodospirillales bacterium]
MKTRRGGAWLGGGKGPDGGSGPAGGGGRGRGRRGGALQALARVLTVLACVALVGAFALATMLPPLTSLGELLAMLDNRTLLGLSRFVRGDAPGWVWTWVVLPLLMRPVWLLPVAVGVVLGGLAITLRNPGAPTSPRWKL